MKFLSILFFLVFCLFNFFQIVNAQNESSMSAEPSIKVDHIANGLEKLGEKIGLYFKFSDTDKLQYKQSLVEKRLAELNYVVENKKNDDVEETASRYSTYLSIFMDEVYAKQNNSEKEKLNEFLDNQLKITERLQSYFESNSGWWLALAHDINTVKRYQGKF